MELIRDLLDMQVVDRDGVKMGKVDGLLLECRPGQPPRLTHVEVGVLTAARRIHRRLPQRLQAVARRLGLHVPPPLRVPIDDVQRRGVDVRVDLVAERTSAFALERWLRRHVVGRIPGAR